MATHAVAIVRVTCMKVSLTIVWVSSHCEEGYNSQTDFKRQIWILSLFWILLQRMDSLVKNYFQEPSLYFIRPFTSICSITDFLNPWMWINKNVLQNTECFLKRLFCTWVSIDWTEGGREGIQIITRRKNLVILYWLDK